MPPSKKDMLFVLTKESIITVNILQLQVEKFDSRGRRRKGLFCAGWANGRYCPMNLQGIRLVNTVIFIMQTRITTSYKKKLLGNFWWCFRKPRNMVTMGDCSPSRRAFQKRQIVQLSDDYTYLIRLSIAHHKACCLFLILFSGVFYS